MHHVNHLRRLSAALLVSVAAAGAACGQNKGAIAGIDHIPVAVRDLPSASQNFEKLGFSLKPGREHAAGIRNQHIKFPDGSGLELITAHAATDELSATYLEHLKAGDGPAYVSFHVRDAGLLSSRLEGAGIEFHHAAGLTTFKDPRLSHVFVILDNRSPTDRPAHFAHANGAVAMSEVWIATDDPAPLKALLLALGATETSGTVRVPDPTDGDVFELQNGVVVLVRGRHQLREGRPVIGVVMSTRLPRGGRREASTAGSSRLIEPRHAHGLWLELRAQ